MPDLGQIFWDGKAYERLMGRWSRRIGADFIDWLGMPARLRWLDVGCGNGAFTEELILRCAPAAVEAIDPSEGQIAYARTRNGAKMANFHLGDAQSLPFDNDSFDVAVMALVIAFIADPAKAIAEMARVVRPGGWIATYMWDGPGGGAPLHPLHTALQSLGIDAPRAPNSAVSTQDQMRGLWEAAGLASIDSKVFSINVEYTDLDDFWDSNIVPIGPQGNVLRELSATAKDQLRERLRKQLPTAADGRISYQAFGNAVKGRVPGGWKGLTRLD
jgi:ubiquinone/menaquinone biosynthesis C-methylase UbiE